MFDPAVEVATAAVLAGRIEAAHARLVEAECEELVLAAAWADAHYFDPDGSGPEAYRPLVERACAWGGDGCPQVSEYAAAELGALRGTSATSARLLIADALDLRHRHPVLWTLVSTGGVRAWQARAVAQATHPLTWDQAVDVDRRLSGFLPLLPWARFRRLLAAAVLDADPEAARAREEEAARSTGVWALDGEHGLKTLIAKAASGDVTVFLAVVNRIADLLSLDGDHDPVDARRARAIGILAQPAHALQLLIAHRDDPDPAGPPPDPEPGDRPDLTTPDLARDTATLARLARAARPRVVLHLHLDADSPRNGDGLVRPEHGDPLTLQHTWDWLASTGCPVTLKPVHDPLANRPVDAYETPARLRDALTLRNPVDVFPYGQATSRTLDLDHTIPWNPLDHGGPPGQTGLQNLGPLTRTHHRTVTHSHWRRRQPEPGTYLYRSPTGYLFAVTNHGTLRLGRSGFTNALWDAVSANETEEENAYAEAA